MKEKERVRVVLDRDLADLIPEYLENRNKDIEKFQSALKSKDFQTINILGHRLAGNAGGYGFHELGLIGKELESFAKIGDEKSLGHCIKKIEDYLKNLEITYE